MLSYKPSRLFAAVCAASHGETLSVCCRDVDDVAFLKLTFHRRIDSLSRDIREGNGEAISEFRRQIGDLYRLKFNFLDEICRQYYSYGLTAAKQRKILKAVEGSISELSGDRDFSALESIVNTFKDDVMRKLREEFPGEQLLPERGREREETSRNHPVNHQQHPE